MEKETTKEQSKPEPDGEISFEERVVEIFLTVAFPFLIGFIAWGVIILAYYQWKIY